MAKDKFHDDLVQALIDDGWTVTETGIGNWLAERGIEKSKIVLAYLPMSMREDIPDFAHN
ncbi:MAG: hypothetical protein AAFO07_09570 [Bacteroidota bacterium]